MAEDRPDVLGCIEPTERGLTEQQLLPHLLAQDRSSGGEPSLTIPH